MRVSCWIGFWLLIVVAAGGGCGAIVVQTMYGSGGMQFAPAIVFGLLLAVPFGALGKIIALLERRPGA